MLLEIFQFKDSFRVREIKATKLIVENFNYYLRLACRDSSSSHGDDFATFSSFDVLHDTF